MLPLWSHGLGCEEVAPYQGRVLHREHVAGGNGFGVVHVEQPGEVGLCPFEGGRVVTHDMEGVVVRPVRIDAVGGETAPKPVAPVVHGAHGVDGHGAGYEVALAVDDTEDAAPRDVLVEFPEVLGSLHDVSPA